MNRLYIIGNGFDLYHGFHTRYSDFMKYLQVHNPELLELIHNYYYLENDVDFWASFEESLSKLDKEKLLENLSDYLPVISGEDFKDRDWSSFSIEVKGLVDTLVHGVREEFRSFILSATSEVEIELKLPLQSDARYFSFNYSETLEKHYNVPSGNITYIHGKASDFSNPIILGHGIEPERFKMSQEKPPEGVSSTGLERWYEHMSDSYNYAYELGVDEVYDYFVSSFKNTSSIINDNSMFFLSLGTIENVYVLGHSLSDIDFPYLQKIYTGLPKSCQWHVSFRGEDEYLEKQEIVQSLGVPKRLINMIELYKLT